MVYKFFGKKSTGTFMRADKSATHTGIGINSENQRLSDLALQQLADELQKPIVKKFKSVKYIYSFFKDNTWGEALAEMQLISKYNKGIRLLLCVIDIVNVHRLFH